LRPYIKDSGMTAVTTTVPTKTGVTEVTVTAAYLEEANANDTSGSTRATVATAAIALSLLALF
jgi:hypothetical protein